MFAYESKQLVIGQIVKSKFTDRKYAVVGGKITSFHQSFSGPGVIDKQRMLVAYSLDHYDDPRGIKAVHFLDSRNIESHDTPLSVEEWLTHPCPLLRILAVHGFIGRKIYYAKQAQTGSPFSPIPGMVYRLGLMETYMCVLENLPKLASNPLYSGQARIKAWDINNNVIQHDTVMNLDNWEYICKIPPTTFTEVPHA